MAAHPSKQKGEEIRNFFASRGPRISVSAHQRHMPRGLGSAAVKGTTRALALRLAGGVASGVCQARHRRGRQIGLVFDRHRPWRAGRVMRAAHHGHQKGRMQ